MRDKNIAWSFLEEITVLDCSVFLPGPYCTMMLAELGANVIKVERVSSGDPVRAGTPAFFRYLNGNKKLVTLDLKKKRGVEIFLELAKRSDVVVEGFRPGVVKRLGIDFETVKEVNPSIIYCSISGYGQTGPYAHIPGHDINYLGPAGILGISGDPESGPDFSHGFQVADISGAMFALSSILAALLRSIESSPAVYLDVSMTESAAMWALPRFLEYMDRGKPSKAELMARGSYGVFETRDGQYLTLGVIEENFWASLCNILGFDDLARDTSLKGWIPRNLQRERIVPRLKKAIKEKDLDYWLEKFLEADIPASPVKDFNNWMHDPQLKYRRFLTVDDHGEVDLNRMKRFPVNSLTRPDCTTEEEPSLGKDTSTVLQGIGLSQEDVHLLKEDKII
ncbi:MAG: CaiB/BaiF CoA-transferase family protein [Thermodesulfobacteriota bacterium]|nr:CaiB/BaiF CoA-transferase family protein [Thermodesulfobacteriota bacterium]